MSHDHWWAKLATLVCLAGTVSCGSQDGTPSEPLGHEAWTLSMQKTTPEGKGCFTADYPSTEWREVPCVATPNIPMTPRPPSVIGNQADVSAGAPTGTISQTIGTFENITNVTSESGLVGNSGTPVADAYTLQINTNFMTSSACAGSPNVGCQGWEQFVYFNDGTAQGSAFIQYWLIQYNATCPAGWNQFSFTGDTAIYCYRDSPTAVSVPNQPIANMANWSLSGIATATGDSVSMGTGASVFTTNGGNFVNASAGWTVAEFNIFGAGGSADGGGQANFNAGASVNVRTRITYGGTAAPNCVAQGFTGETNNLNFGPTAPTSTPPGPAMLFQMSTDGGATSFCAAAVGVGDTHLRTLSGLLYDFQASGDFVLIETTPTVIPDPDPPAIAIPTPPTPAPAPGADVPIQGGVAPPQRFVVQTRQVSGAPTWPDASVNQAVAMQMGNTKVALCLPGSLVIDGYTTDLEDGGALLLPNVKISRTGNSYLIRSRSGDSVQAVVNPTWIDVSVGLGFFPIEAHGLLVNANGNINQLAARDGTVLTAPFPFDQFYGAYADSWRVLPNESLLSICDPEGQVETGIPARPFYAQQLDRGDYRRARAACRAAGVKEKLLLDACILDVAVLGEGAAQVYVGAVPPAAVGLVVQRKHRHHRHHHHRRHHRHHHHGWW